ncbi:unnamed protein product [Leuciscus chuanchicus]
MPDEEFKIYTPDNLKSNVWLYFGLPKKQGKITSRDGGEFDIQCGGSTDISVVLNLGFPIKNPPVKYKTLMAPKQNVRSY